MKKSHLLVLTMTMITGTASAVKLGAVDPTFSQDGITDGWDMSGETGFNWYGNDVVVDSQGRILIAGTYQYDFNGQTELMARVERRLPNGDLDNSFDGDGILDLAMIPASQSQFDYGLVLDLNDGVFVGYSRIYCQTSTACESDPYVYHISSTGTIIGSQQVQFDIGSTIDRQDAALTDLVYVPSINKLAMSVEVELSNVNDTDFGIAVLEVGPSGSLSVDTSFSTDGQTTCYFDHADPSGSRDFPTSIVWHNGLSRFIMAGSSFEGNGISGDGWNMAFCEFDLTGGITRKWSTQSQTPALDSREFLNDLVVYHESGIGGQSYLVGIGGLPGGGGMDTSLFRYQETQFGQWGLDTSFGSNGTGYELTGFEYLFQGETHDVGIELLIEPEDSSILVLSSLGWDESGVDKAAFGLTKYTKNGILNTSWGIGNGRAVHTFDVSNRWDIAEGLAINQQTEEIYVTGMSYDGLNFKSTVANMHNDMIFGGNFDF